MLDICAAQLLAASLAISTKAQGKIISPLHNYFWRRSFDPIWYYVILRKAVQYFGTGIANVSTADGTLPA